MTDRLVWWTPVMTGREKVLLNQVIDSNFPNDGPLTAQLEERIATLVDARYAVAVTSGTAAIFLALVACGVGAGDEVLVPDITFIASANAVSLAGGTPVLVDVDPATLCMDPECVEAAITARTRAILPVHVSGRAAAMPQLLDVAQRHGLAVVEDAAEALGSRRWGRNLGVFGDAGCFSFTANKTITTGQGGVVVTNDGGIHRRLRELKDQGRPVRGTGGADEHVSLGFNFKFTDLQAAMGLAQLDDLDRRLAHLRQVFAWYEEGLADTPGVRLPGFNLDEAECPQWVDLIAEDRDSLHDFLLERGVETRKFWYPLHTQAPYRTGDSRFPVSTELSYKALWLPSSFTMTGEDVNRVCQLIKLWALQRLASQSSVGSMQT